MAETGTAENIHKMPQHRTLAFRHRGGYLVAGDGLLHNLSLVDNVALQLRFWQYPE